MRKEDTRIKIMEIKKSRVPGELVSDDGKPYTNKEIKRKYNLVKDIN